jgi:hypothetical protein
LFTLYKGESVTRKNVEPKTKIPLTPVCLTATSGDLDGEIDLIWEPVEGANSYVIEINRSNNKPDGWIQEDVITKSSYTASRLKSGHKYWFRVSAAGSKGQSSWSEPVGKKAP